MCSRPHSVEKRQTHFPATQIFFRQINLEYNSLVKQLLWRNFCKKILAEKFRDFHSVFLVQYFSMLCLITKCGNYGNSFSRIFAKNYVKITVLLNKLLKSWFDEIFCWWERISRFSTLCIKDFFREINSLDDFFVKLTLNNFFNKSVDFTEFLVKKVRLRMSQNIIFSSLFWKNHTNYVRKNQMQQRKE